MGFAGPKRIMQPAISLDDLPKSDMVLISHNHYDHLDKKSVLAITENQKKILPFFLVPLGMKAWFADIGIKERVVGVGLVGVTSIGRLEVSRRTRTTLE